MINEDIFFLHKFNLTQLPQNSVLHRNVASAVAMSGQWNHSGHIKAP
jgi:hypothetical protein